MRFETIEDAFEVRAELKTQLNAFDELLSKSDSILLNSKGEALYVKKLPTRVPKEIPWYEAFTSDGKSFGYIDPATFEESCDDTLDAQRIAIEADGKQVTMICIDLATARTDAKEGNPIDRWIVPSDQKEIFDRLIGNPYKELKGNYAAVGDAINRMAEKIGK
jgi:hypothetical protein